MVHFDFTVSDEDADTIMSIMRDAQLKSVHMEDVLNPTWLSTKEQRAWWKRHSRYLNNIIKSMKNERVPE